MIENVARFGEKNLLSGIVTLPPQPADASAKPALIILNSGLLPRFGPNRLSVKLARAVAARGRLILRFDFSGVGESPALQTDLSYEERALIELGQAFDYLLEKHGCTKFILTGICSGADAAFQAACKDKRIVGIIPIDLFSSYSTNYMVYSYKKRLLSPKSWLNLLRGNSDLVNILKKVLTRITVFKTIRASQNTPSSGNDTGIESPEDAEYYSTGFHSLSKMKIPVFMIYSSGSPAYFNYNKHFKKTLVKIDKPALFKVLHLSTADHGFTFLYHQELIISKSCEWLAEI